MKENVNNDLSASDILPTIDLSKYVTKDDYIRLAADFDNYKKRNAKLELNAYDRGSRDVIEQVLSLYDDMERLMKIIDKSIDEKTVSGFEMILENFEKILASFECKKIDTQLGDKFDVNYHEAISSRSLEEKYEEDDICDIYQSGWMLNGILLRPVKVVIKKN